MRLLHLHWPHLLLRLAETRLGTAIPVEPVIVGGKPWTAGTVLDANPAALALGVRRGMPLGSAHRLAPEALFLDPDPAFEAAALEAALDRLARFSPAIAAETDPSAPAFGRLEVQLDGLDRLWGPEETIVERLFDTLHPVLPGAGEAGIAGPRFAAAAAGALAGRGRFRSVPCGDDAAFLAPLPASRLTADPEVRRRLERFGLRRIGEVAVLPRSSLVARFGGEGERLHDRANGVETAPFRPRRAPEKLVLSLPIEPPVEHLEALRVVLHRLAGAFGDQLVARGAATSRPRLTLELDRTFSATALPPRVAFDQRLPEPTSEGLAIERLLMSRLEASPPPAPVSRMELELDDVAPAAGFQLTLFTPQAGRTSRLGWQLARLALRFGSDRVGWAELADVDAPLPELRWAKRPVAGSEGGSR